MAISPRRPFPHLRREHGPVSTSESTACMLEVAQQRAGIAPGRSRAIDTGVPLLALAFLAVALIVAWSMPDAAQRPAIPAVALVAVAAVPWLRWLAVGDEGPSWGFVLSALVPLTIVVTGHVFLSDVGLSSAAAVPMLAFPGLFIIVLVVGVAPARMAIGMTICAWAAFVGPMFGAAIAGRGTAPTTVMTWVVVYTLAVVAGYTMRMSFQAAIAVDLAQEAMARQSIEEERRRIARDVHDMVAHTLAVTMLHMTSARMAVRRQDPMAAEAALQVAERHGRESLNDIRRMVRLLRADMPDDAAPQPGFESVEVLVGRYREAGLHVDLALEIDGSMEYPGSGLAIYRILQEALANAARHGTGPASVQLRVTDAGSTLHVRNPAAIRAINTAPGSGIIGMRERSIAAGGSFTAGLRQGEWTIEAMIPSRVGA